jgi:hypothetical protein
MRNVRSLPVVILAILPTSCSYAPNDPANTALKRGLAVEVRPGSGLYSVRGQYSVTIRFQNNGPEPVSIIEPLDGSTRGRHMPHYRFNMWDADQKPLEPAKGCGTWNDGRWSGTQWPRDYLVEIKPGLSHDLELALPCEIGRDGAYTIAFEYVYRPDNESLDPPPSAWRGSVKAPAVVLNLKLN